MELDFSKIAGRGFPKPIASVYLFQGSDDALKHEAMLLLTDTLVDPEFADFDRELRDVSISGGSAEGDLVRQILASAGGAPMFSEWRVVIVTNVQRLSKEDQDNLAASLGKLCARTCLVLVAGAPEYDAGKVKARSVVGTKLVTAVAKAGAVVTCDAPSAGDLRARATALASSLGKTIAPQAAQIVVERAVAAAADRGGAGKSGDLNVLHSELEKAAAYVGSRPTITVDDVRAVGTRGVEENIFALLDAVGRRDSQRALGELEEMFRSGDKPDGIAARTFVMLARHLRLLWGARYLASKKLTANNIRGSLPPDVQETLSTEMVGLTMRQSFLLRSLQEQARGWSEVDLRVGLTRVLASDLAMKGGASLSIFGLSGVPGDDPASNLRLLIVALCQRN